MNQKETRWYTKAITIARDRKGWSRADLVRDIARVTVSSDSAAYAWLNGNREPPLEVIRRIAKECLGVSIGELIEDDPYFLTDEQERELMDGFRELTQEQRDLFRQLILAQTIKAK
jgi:transcriptional regulator with XRE-family HTH domain